MENVNKEGMEIMADLNLEIQKLKEENEKLKFFNRDCKEETERFMEENEILKEELEAEKQENELYMDYLDVADAEEAREWRDNMNEEIADLERKNQNLQESNNLLVRDSLKLKKKIYGDGLEYLLEN